MTPFQWLENIIVDKLTIVIQAKFKLNVQFRHHVQGSLWPECGDREKRSTTHHIPNQCASGLLSISRGLWILPLPCFNNWTIGIGRTSRGVRRLIILNFRPEHRTSYVGWYVAYTWIPWTTRNEAPIVARINQSSIEYNVPPFTVCNSSLPGKHISYVSCFAATRAYFDFFTRLYF